MPRSSKLFATLFRMIACAVLVLFAACGEGEDTGSRGTAGTTPTGTTTTQTTSGRAALLGTWRGTPVQFTSNGRSFNITMRMKFESSRVGMNARCSFDTGDILEADAFVRAELTDTHVKTLEADNQEVRLDDMSCRANLGVFNARYRIDGKTLTLTFDEGEPLALTRE